MWRVRDETPMRIVLNAERENTHLTSCKFCVKKFTSNRYWTQAKVIKKFTNMYDIIRYNTFMLALYIV